MCAKGGGSRSQQTPSTLSEFFQPISEFIPPAGALG
jgi:hypothetical protein